MTNQEDFRKILEEEEARERAGLTKREPETSDRRKDSLWGEDLYWREADRKPPVDEYDDLPDTESADPRKKYNAMRVEAEKPAEEEEEEEPKGWFRRLNFLRKRTEEEKKEHSGTAYRTRERERRFERIRDVFVIFAVAFAFVPAILLYAHNYRYSTYSVDSEIYLGASYCKGIYVFGDSNVIVGNDSVSMVRDDTVLWTVSVALDHPVFMKEGNYFAIASRGGYKFCIFDASGLQSTVNVSRKIRALDISAAGVVAVSTESDTSSFVSYFDRYGKKIGVEVKTLLDASGYPMSLSISPDGQRLVVLYYRVQNGIGESAIVVYDFQNGKKERYYQIAEYSDFYATGTYLTECRFLDDRHAIAVGDKELVFLSDFQRGNVERRREPLTGVLRSVLFTEEGLLTVVRENGENICRLYDGAGSVITSYPCPESYDAIYVNGRNVVFGDGPNLWLYNVSGVCRFAGTLPYTPENGAYTSGSSLFFNTGSKFQKITLK